VLGHVGSVLLSVVAQALLCNSLFVGFFLSPSFGDAIDDHQWEVQALSAGFCTEPHHRCRVVEEGVHLLCEMNALTLSSIASAKMLRFHKSSIL
jgi:hypothetical protein